MSFSFERHRAKRFVAAVTAATLAVAVMAPQRGTAAPSSEWVKLPGHVPAALQLAVRTTETLEPVELTVVLRRADQAGFERHLARLYDPNSSEYRRYLSPREIADRFGPSRAAHDALLAHLRANDLELVASSENRLTMTVRGSREAVERAFGVAIQDYHLGERTFFSNATDPSLPADLAGSVQAVIGLTDFAQVHVRHAPQFKPGLKAAKDCKNNTGLSDLARGVCHAFYNVLGVLYNLACVANAISVVGFIVNRCDLIDPVNVPSVVADAAAVAEAPARVGSATGAGQKIGLLQFDSFRRSDVADFLALVGAPPETIDRLSEVKVNGGAPLGANQPEVLLDINVAMMLAPEAEVIVYSAPFGGRGVSFQSLLNRAIDDGVDVISNSWAYCEDQTTLADVESIDSILQAAAAAGISVFSAAGDTGSTCLNGSANTIAVPAGSPFATAVGGTSIVQGPGGTYAGETWWDGSESVPPTGQGGFGESRFFARPGYQNGHTASTMRSIPDISVNADPAANGLPICQADAGGCPTGLYYGGTSVGAPTLAAFTALLNDAHDENLGFMNPQFYDLAGTDAFHDAASMGSDFAHVGLGSPNVAELSRALRGDPLGNTDDAVSLAVVDADTVPADGGSTTHVLVQLRDANGLPVSGKTVSLAANPAGNVTITPPSAVTDVANGAVAFEVSSLVAESVTFTATDATDGVVLLDDAEITFAVPSAAAGSITAFPTTVAADGTSATTITVALRDALDRPVPGKEITISQGGGHSILAGPSPPVTDANGEIQFTATNRIGETVTYTAVDVTDGDLPVPGDVDVTFTGGTFTCVSSTPPEAEDGFAITPFATGFVAEDFFFGGINWGGCPGASYPAFVGEDAYIVNARTGGVYRMGREGGAASSSNLLTTLGPTIGFPTADADGNLYAVFGASTNAFPSGSIVELDPETGVVLRTLAADQKCPTGLVVDPLSGDLFFAHQCFGGAASDPSIHRIRNPRSATPTLEVYATLPLSPNGMLAFAPNGTLYAAAGYTTTTPSVVRVAGTNTSAPPSMTTRSDVPLFFTLTIGSVDEDGEATSLIGPTTEGLEIFDITETPAERTVIAHDLGSGVIGPDGCLYASRSDTVFRLVRADGTCGFDPSGAVPSLTLSPAAVSPDAVQGDELAFTATLRNVPAPEDIALTLDVRGANQKSRLAHADENGSAVLSYVGSFAGDDIVVAAAKVGDATLRSNTVRVTWSPGRHDTFLTLAGSPLGGDAGVPFEARASLVDISLEPLAVVAGQTIDFVLGADQCSAVTDVLGTASCELTPSGFGLGTLTASFAGTASYLPASAAGAFTVVADGVCADFTADGRVLAGDALGILRTAIGLATCDLCVCDADGSGSVVVATDSLIALQFAVGLPVTLRCPPC